MKVTTIDQHLIQLTQLGAINCYLVREEDGFTLIDTCYRGAHRFISEFAVQAKSSVRRIDLTHAHVDHVGSLDALREKLSGVQIIISARERRVYDGDFSLDLKDSVPPRTSGAHKEIIHEFNSFFGLRVQGSQYRNGRGRSVRHLKRFCFLAA